MKRLPIHQFQNATPTILIGLDNENGPIVCRTKLGYVVYGPLQTHRDEETSSEARVLLATSANNCPDLHDLVKLHFSTEDFGVKNTQLQRSKDELRALDILENTTKKVDR